MNNYNHLCLITRSPKGKEVKIINKQFVKKIVDKKRTFNEEIGERIKKILKKYLGFDFLKL